MDSSQPPKTRPPAAFVAMIVLLTSEVGCRNDSDQLKARLTEIDSDNYSMVAQSCSTVGESGQREIRAAIEASRDDYRRRWLILALLECDAQSNLRYLLEYVKDDSNARAFLAESLKGKLVASDRALLQELARDSAGALLATTCLALATVADDYASLQVAKEALARGKADRDQDVIRSALLLLGDAAFYNNDQTAVENIRPFVGAEDRGIQLAAVIAIRAVPGAMAEDELHRIAEKTDHPGCAMAKDFLRTRSSDQQGPKHAPGWR